MNKRIAPQRGFTLQEAVIAVAITGILSAVAFPSYSAYLKKTRRAEAISALASERQSQVHFHLDNRTYRSTLAGLDLANDGTKPYLFEIEPGVTGTYDTSFVIRAIPQEKGDDTCGVLTIDQDGVRKSEKGGAECWR